MLPNDRLYFSNHRNTFEIMDDEYFEPHVYKTYDNDGKLAILMYIHEDNNKRLELTRDNIVASFPINIEGTVTGISLSYDLKNRPMYSYTYTTTNNTISKFVWFNETKNREESFLLMGASMTFIIVDEVRKELSSDSDIVLFYVRNSDSRLCFRYQRDIFRVEHEGPILSDDEKIIKMGRTNNLRIQLESLRNRYRLTYTYASTQDGAPILLGNGEPLWIIKERIDLAPEE